jgi:endonuclease G, mitochondrial
MSFLRRIFILVLLGFSLGAYAAFEECQDIFPGQQIPTSPQAGKDLCFDSFAVYYSPTDKKPIYTVEKLSREQLLTPHPRRSNQFYEEARLPFAERALLSDYRGSGYDRGHNVPAGDMSNEHSMAQSFSLANMMPQARQNNQGIWAKNVEEPTRQYVKRASGDIYIFTGSAGNNGSIGNSHVTIPSHLFKLVYDPSKNRAWAYWVENTNDALMTPPISYQELIEKTGIDFHLPIDSRVNTTGLANPSAKPKIGGWYPVFFDDYSQAKLDQVIKSIQVGRVSRVDIQYDRNSELAQKIQTQIESQTRLKTELIQSSPPNTPAVTYERNRVALIVRTK